MCDDKVLVSEIPVNQAHYYVLEYVRDDSSMDMTAMAKIYNFFSFMNFDK